MVHCGHNTGDPQVWDPLILLLHTLLVCPAMPTPQGVCAVPGGVGRTHVCVETLLSTQAPCRPQKRLHCTGVGVFVLVTAERVQKGNKQTEKHWEFRLASFPPWGRPAVPDTGSAPRRSSLPLHKQGRLFPECFIVRGVQTLMSTLVYCCMSGGFSRRPYRGCETRIASFLPLISH